MDGLFIPKGTIIIASTNHYEKLDSAFVREGRFDFKKEFKYADKHLAVKMVEYYGLDSESVLGGFSSSDYPVSQAKIQSLVFKEL